MSQNHVTLGELVEKYGHLMKPGRIYHITRSKRAKKIKGAVVGRHLGGPGRRRQNKYDLEKIGAELRRKFRPERDRLGFPERGYSWLPCDADGHITSGVNADGLPNRIHRELADRLAARALITAPRMEHFAHIPSPVKFWLSPELGDVVRALTVPAAMPRSVQDLEELGRREPDTFIGFAESNKLGFTMHYLREHSDLPATGRPKPGRKQKHARTPDPALGRVIAGRWSPHVSKRRHLVDAPTWKLSDLLQSRANRGKAFIERNGRLEPLPADALRVSDAAKQWNTPRSTITSLIMARKIQSFPCIVIKKNGARDGASYIFAADRQKLPSYERAGTRRYEFDGRCWLPRVEACAATGLTEIELREWMPRQFGGAGIRCVHLGGKLIDVKRHGAKRKGGDTLLVLAADHLEKIRAAKHPDLPAIALPPAAPRAALRLSGRAKECAEAMEELRAFDRASRATAEQITLRAAGPEADPNAMKHPLSELVRAGRAECQRGRGGGYWLVP